jgi:hypothetical protein
MLDLVSNLILSQSELDHFTVAKDFVTEPTVSVGGNDLVGEPGGRGDVEGGSEVIHALIMAHFVAFVKG